MSRKIPCVSRGATKVGESNDCVVRALTNVTGKSYDEIHALLDKHGRKHGKGTFMPTTFAAMKELGFMPVIFKSGYENYHTSKYWNTKLEERKSLGKVVSELTKGRFVVYVKGHATSLIDGSIVDTFDQSKSKPVHAIWWHPEISFKNF